MAKLSHDQHLLHFSQALHAFGRWSADPPRVSAASFQAARTASPSACRRTAAEWRPCARCTSPSRPPSSPPPSRAAPSRRVPRSSCTARPTARNRARSPRGRWACPGWSRRKRGRSPWSSRSSCPPRSGPPGGEPVHPGDVLRQLRGSGEDAPLSLCSAFRRLPPVPVNSPFHAHLPSVGSMPAVQGGSITKGLPGTRVHQDTPISYRGGSITQGTPADVLYKGTITRLITEDSPSRAERAREEALSKGQLVYEGISGHILSYERTTPQNPKEEGRGVPGEILGLKRPYDVMEGGISRGLPIRDSLSAANCEGLIGRAMPQERHSPHHFKESHHIRGSISQGIPRHVDPRTSTCGGRSSR
ncbi:hypothetical protein ANANG_G00191130 [Anguilla anguilla]|uniref:Uncharacterized protein n=1 Tax=Anguilla anguilla TaxID=7936 RepID=A0A9D3M152_ANGAN|nr:hypothetical protein ANANG_G00191130 [Anguilla anguilla]